MNHDVEIDVKLLLSKYSSLRLFISQREECAIVLILFFESFNMTMDFKLLSGLLTVVIKFFVRSNFFNEVKWLKARTGIDVSLFLLSFNDWTEVRFAKAFTPILEIRLLFNNRYCKDSFFVTF